MPTLTAIAQYVKNILQNAIEIKGPNSHMFFLQIDPRNCTIDRRYQTDLRCNRKSKLAENWDIRLCDPIKVSYRNGELLVLDGWHRCQAAIQNGEATLPCYLYLDLAFEEEVSLFINQNKNVLKISPKELWFGMLAGQYPRASALKAVFDAYGFDVYSTPGRHPKHSISSIGTIMEITDTMTSDEVTDWAEWTFHILSTLNWGSLRGGTYDRIILAFNNVYKTHLALGTLDEASANLCRFMRFFSPMAIQRLAVLTCDSRNDIRSCLTLYFSNIANGTIFNDDVAETILREQLPSLIAQGLVDANALRDNADNS